MNALSRPEEGENSLLAVGKAWAGPSMLHDPRRVQELEPLVALNSMVQVGLEKVEFLTVRIRSS